MARASIAAVAVAAAFAALFLPPPGGTPPSSPTRDAGAVHREGVITTTVEPRIVEDSAVAPGPGRLHWTSVPSADRYRLRVFDREGTVVWEYLTPDTSVAIAEIVLTDGGEPYLWKVDARTGWDRWVSSDWSSLVTGRPRGREP